MSEEGKAIEDLRNHCDIADRAWNEYQRLSLDETTPVDQLDRACAYFEWCAERVDYDAVILLLREYDRLRASVRVTGEW